MSKQRLSVPRGARQLSLGDYLKARLRVEQLEECFKIWGYLPVVTPLVDFFSVYEDFLSAGEARMSYRLFDREGELLIIRSDITLFLAKQISMQLRSTSLPLRLSYSEEILRDTFEHDIVKGDIHQSGVELIGVPGIDGDVEVLLLLFECLDLLEGREAVVHLGSHAFLRACADQFCVDMKLLVSALQVRNRAAVEKLFPRNAAPLVKLLFFIGDVNACEGCRDAANALLNSEARDALSHVFRIAVLLERTDFYPRLRIDLSETAMRNYYSGIVFAAYSEDAESAISVGGRYDRLLSHFGDGAPAAGFSIYPHKRCSSISATQAPTQLHIAQGTDILDKYYKAKILRKKGKVTTL